MINASRVALVSNSFGVVKALRALKLAALAQLVERRLGKAEVGSSNLLGSSKKERIS